MHRGARQGTETHEQKWAWVEASVWTERMLAALELGVKGGKWFSLIDKVYDPRVLEAAFRHVATRKGASGVDGVSIERFREQAGRYYGELSDGLRLQTYCPEPVKRVNISKGDGKTRPLGIPAVKDRVVQTALKMVIEPIFEKEFLALSYGFRPGKGCKDALKAVDELIKSGYTYVVDADIERCFDSIPHEGLMNRVKERLSDGRVLRLIELFLKQDILEGMNRWTPFQGTPQGAVLSPLLANIYLHPLDVVMKEAGHAMIRYADDSVVLCKSREEAEAAHCRMQTWMSANGLQLHPEKTHIGDCRMAGEGFEFLGYRFEAGRRYVRKKSLKALRSKIRGLTKRTCGKSLKQVIALLNPILRGWFGYFKHAYHTTFRDMDGFVRRRLRAILRKHEKRPGRGKCLADHMRWPNAFFAARGLFTMALAFTMACRSR